MSEIIKHNFGKEGRERARRFARLLKIAEDYEADILADPVKYMQLASQRIGEYELFIEQLRESIISPWAMTATWQPPNTPPTMDKLDTIVIDRRDYDALQAVKALLNSRK